MSHNTIKHVHNKELRSFGLTTGAVVGVLFGLVIPWLWGLNYPYWPWVVLLLLGLLGLIAPALLRPVYRIWMRIGLLISKVTTPIIMAVVFYLIIMPVGLIRRIFGRDSLDRQFDEHAKSYRKDADEKTAGPLERPY